MAVADVVILNIARILDRTGDLKDTNKSIGFIMAFVRTRGVAGMFRHFFYSISAFLLHLADDAKQWLLPSCPIVKKTRILTFYIFSAAFATSSAAQIHQLARSAGRSATSGIDSSRCPFRKYSIFPYSFPASI